MGKNWLITGGCGFIGVNLIKFLAGKEPDSNIRILDNLEVGTKDDLADVSPFHELNRASIEAAPRGVELVIGDIRDYETCVQCARGAEIIVHLAGNTGVPQSIEAPLKDMEYNVRGTLNLLEAARIQQVHKFILASSSAVIGETEPPIHENKLPRPVAPYGVSKLAGESYCRVYFGIHGIRTVSLRFGNVYGPHSKHKGSVVAKFIKQALNGETLEIYGDGKQTRDFIYIDDLVDALHRSALANVGGEVFQIATFKETTINNIVMEIKRILEQEHGGATLKVINAAQRAGDVKNSFSDISKAREMLGFEPRFTLSEGLAKTVGYFMARRNQ